MSEVNGPKTTTMELNTRKTYQYQFCLLSFIDKNANCSFKFKQLQSVPNNLPVDIQKLDLSHNNITNLANHSFDHYASSS